MGYAILGSVGTENKDICLLRTDYSGNELWFQTYGGSQHDEARHIKQTIDDGFIISGFTKSYGFGEEDAWIIKVDASGLMDWNAKFGTPGNDRASQVLQDDDGGYIIVGEKQSSNLNQSDLWILKSTLKVSFLGKRLMVEMAMIKVMMLEKRIIASYC